MKGYKHLTINTPIMILIGCLVYYYVLDSTIVVIGAYLGVIFGNISDMDLTIGQKYHRHFLFHSIIWTVVMWLFALQYPEMMLVLSFTILGVGIHCLEDIQLIKASMRGTYTIKVRQTITGKVKGLSGWNSTIWLVANFIVSVVLFVITCVVVA